MLRSVMVVVVVGISAVMRLGSAVIRAVVVDGALPCRFAAAVTAVMIMLMLLLLLLLLRANVLMRMGVVGAMAGKGLVRVRACRTSASACGARPVRVVVVMLRTTTGVAMTLMILVTRKLVAAMVMRGVGCKRLWHSTHWCRSKRHARDGHCHLYRSHRRREGAASLCKGRERPGLLAGKGGGHSLRMRRGSGGWRCCLWQHRGRVHGCCRGHHLLPGHGRRKVPSNRHAARHRLMVLVLVLVRMMVCTR